MASVDIDTAELTLAAERHRGYVDTVWMPDATDYKSGLASRGVAYSVATLGNLATWSAPIEEVRYVSPRSGEPLIAYLVTTEDADSWSQSVVIFREPMEGPDAAQRLQRILDAYRAVQMVDAAARGAVVRGAYAAAIAAGASMADARRLMEDAGVEYDKRRAVSDD